MSPPLIQVQMERISLGTSVFTPFAAVNYRAATEDGKYTSDSWTVTFGSDSTNSLSKYITTRFVVSGNSNVAGSSTIQQFNDLAA